MLFDPCQSFKPRHCCGYPEKQFSNTSYNFIIIVIHARTSINSLVPFGLNWPGLTWLDSAWLWLSFWTIFFNQRNVRFRKSPWPNSHHTYLFLFEAFMSSQQAFRLISTRFIWSVCPCVWVSKLPDQHSQCRQPATAFRVSDTHFVVVVVDSFTISSFHCNMTFGATVDIVALGSAFLALILSPLKNIFGTPSNINICTHLTLFSN